MTNERFKEIYERSSNDLMYLCYEVFSEEGRTKMSLQQFNEYFPVWITNMKIDTLFMSGGNINAVTQEGLREIEVYLKKKYSYEEN